MVLFHVIPPKYGKNMARIDVDPSMWNRSWWASEDPIVFSHQLQGEKNGIEIAEQDTTMVIIMVFIMVIIGDYCDGDH